MPRYTLFFSLILVSFSCGGGGEGSKDAKIETDAREVADAVDEVKKEIPPSEEDIGGFVDLEVGDAPGNDVLVEEALHDTLPQDASRDDTRHRYHPEGWATYGSANFHGTAAKQNIAKCTSCHGSDLSGGAVGVSCDSCHTGFKTNCVFCHGGRDNQSGAPPVDISDGDDISLVTVGAHTAHVSAKSQLAVGLDCVACHSKPTSALDQGHIDGSPAEVLDSLGWDRDSATCSTGYCHGNFIGGNASNRPKWTSVGQAQCGSCHALPPSTGRHPSVFGKHSFMGNDCTHCHSGIANNGATEILDPAKHINFTKDVVLKAGGTWDSQTKTCDPACHGAKQW